MRLVSKKDDATKYRQKNRELLRQKQKSRRFGYKETVFSHYGLECVICGFNDIRALNLDHIDDSGADHRRSLGGQKFAGHHFYKWVIDNDFPKNLQTLCANCNSIKQYNKNRPNQGSIV